MISWEVCHGVVWYSMSHLLSPVIEGCNASVDHGLDSKALANFHLSWHFWVSVVHDAWVVGMKLNDQWFRMSNLQSTWPLLTDTDELVDSVTDILSHDAEALRLDNRLDFVSNIPVKSTWLYQGNGSLHRFLCRGN
jgi:hypothetical protein